VNQDHPALEIRGFGPGRFSERVNPHTAGQAFSGIRKSFQNCQVKILPKPDLAGQDHLTIHLKQHHQQDQADAGSPPFMPPVKSYCLNLSYLLAFP
jgi:hypothetical protein